MNLNLNFIVLFFSLLSILLSEKIGYVHYLEGSAIIQNKNIHLQDKKAILGREIYSGDHIKVDENSRCSILFKDKKSQIIIDSNSKVQVLGSDLSKEVKIQKGSAFIHNLLDFDKKFYVFTHNNQFFLETDRVWISSDFHKGDELFSLDNKIKVFNNLNDFSTTYYQNKVHYYFNTGKIISSDIVNNVVPQYVLDKINDDIYEVAQIKLERYDLIPIYGERIRSDKDKNLMKYSYSVGTLSLNSDMFLRFGFYPRYKNKTLTIAYSFEPNFSTDGELLDNDWDDVYDIVDRLYINYYHRENYKNNEMNLRFGQLKNINFAEGYLLKGLNNSLDYPRLRNSGFLLDYKFDEDFINLKVVMPNFSDFLSSDGGIFAAHTSLFISHRFPLTLGFGVVADFNQLSSVEKQYSSNVSRKRTVYGAEVDFNYDMLSYSNFQLSLFGEMVGIWYPESTFYTLFDTNQISNDLRYRNGTWGIKGPGIEMKFNNNFRIKLAMNQNSALFIPSYFNSNYFSNRTRLYNGQLNFPLVDQQVDLLEQFKVKGENDKYIVPKDLYPILLNNKGFSVYKVNGISGELFYDFTDNCNYMISIAVFNEDSPSKDSFYNFETSIDIKEDFFDLLSSVKFYYSNLFFEDISDKSNLTFGFSFNLDLPKKLSLGFDLGQMFYNSNLVKDDLEQMLNAGINLNYNF